MLSRFCPARFGVLFCSVVLYSDTHREPLDRVDSGARFLTWDVFECDIAHRRSVAVLCMLYKIRCHPVHPLYGTLSLPHVPVRVTRDARVAHRYTYGPPRFRTSHFPRTFMSLLSVSLLVERFLLTLHSMVWNWRVSRAGLMLFYWHKAALSIFVFYYFSLSLLSVYIDWYCGTGVFGLIW